MQSLIQIINDQLLMAIVPFPNTNTLWSDFEKLAGFTAARINLIMDSNEADISTIITIRTIFPGIVSKFALFLSKL